MSAAEPLLVPEQNFDVPLVVDMDGTLVRSDTLFEGVAQLLRANPFAALALPVWLLRGRAGFKSAIAERVPLDVQHLPFNMQLISSLRNEVGRRRIILCTAADHRFAERVASHVGVFNDVMASRDGTNLGAAVKAQALVERYGKGGFDYAANDLADLPVFAAARTAWIVNPTRGLERRLSKLLNVGSVVPSDKRHSLAEHLRALRPHQWLKNLLVFLPLLATLQEESMTALLPASLAFMAFCLVASSVYLLNDLLDLESDRRHPRKRLRPFAAGTVPIRNGLMLIPALLLTGAAVAWAVSSLFVLIVAVYYVSTLLYTFWLKRVVLLDTLLLAGLYTLRILGGAAAILVVPSFWLLAFSMFFFLSVALAKRHAELVEMSFTQGVGTLLGRGYRAEDLTTLIAQGSASGYAAVLVLALYINSDAVRAQYNHPEVIWLICPLLLYWVNKLWLNAQRREVTDDPLVWAMENRVSRGIALLSVLLLLLARWLPPFP